MAFIGVTEKGPLDRALMIASFSEFQANYGSFLRVSWLAYSALQFFANGGTHLYIARVTNRGGTEPQEIDYQNAFVLLDPITDINLVAVPGFGSPSMASYGANYCQKRGDCFFIGDMSLSENTKEEVQTFIDSIGAKSSYAAVYIPWLKIKDPSGASPDPIAIPPSGSVAGVYARVDAKRGVWKAPAGKETNIKGAVGSVADISGCEQDKLNHIGVNVIRAFPANGIAIMGARTLATLSDLEYRYVQVRRTAIYIERGINRGIQWVVFEPNDESLWAQIRLNVKAFMHGLFRQGALRGSSPDQAYFVRCDRETTTQSDINQGIVNILVGFAPLKPAEFLILQFSQRVREA
jgi:phage tail sheath protein FI